MYLKILSIYDTDSANVYKSLQYSVVVRGGCVCSKLSRKYCEKVLMCQVETTETCG